MKNIFILNSTESKLKYIKVSAPTIYERILSELENDNTPVADFKNSLIISKATFEAFEASGVEAIITTDIYDVPAIQHYLTKGTTALIDGKYGVVDSKCFTRCPFLESITFEEGVECIKEQVLCDNPLVKSITFPESLNFIGANAFRNCENLSEVVFKNPKTWISPDAFEGTQWFSQHTEEFVIINGQLLKYNGNSEDIIIPEGIEHISEQVFSENEQIKTVSCPSTLETIWTYSFADCTNLQKVILNDNLKIISLCAFEGCINLKEINFPKSLEDLGAMAFDRRTLISFYDTNKTLTEHITETYPNHTIID